MPTGMIIRWLERMLTGVINMKCFEINYYMIFTLLGQPNILPNLGKEVKHAKTIGIHRWESQNMGIMGIMFFLVMNVLLMQKTMVYPYLSQWWIHVTEKIDAKAQSAKTW